MMSRWAGLNEVTSARRERERRRSAVGRFGAVAAGAACGLALMTSPAALAQAAGGEAAVTLTNGDVLRGTLVSRTADTVVLDHPTLGRVTLATSLVRSTQPAGAQAGQPALPAAPPADKQPEAATEPEPEAEPEPDARPEIEPVEEDLWDLSVELGISGSQGVTDRENVRAAFLATRETDDEKFDFRTRYRLAREDSENVENQLLVDARNDWYLPESKWSIFALAGGEYNQFRDFDLRLRGGGGMGYRFIDNERTALTGSAGLTARYDIGGDPEEVVPEALFALDLTHEINDRSRFLAGAEYLPSLEEFPSDYRINALAAYELDVNDDGSLALRLGVENRYDISQPEGDKNEFDYFLTLVYTF